MLDRERARLLAGLVGAFVSSANSRVQSPLMLVLAISTKTRRILSSHRNYTRISLTAIPSFPVASAEIIVVPVFAAS